MKKRIITSALPYVNNHPHLGNIIGCVLSADVYSRFCKKNGEDAIHICGTDEYGTAVEMEAILSGRTPSEICEENRVTHKRVYDWFDIHFDYFGSTSSPNHINLVQEFFIKMYSNGYFKREEIEQFYCEKCELFLADRYVIGKCKTCGDNKARGDQCDACGNVHRPFDLESPCCSICNSTPTTRRTLHLFFDLETFKPQLRQLYKNHGSFWSENARNIFNQWINMDLHPRCMTRDLKFKWGVPVPLEGFEDKVFYVWFDAPIGYFTFLKELVGGEFDLWCNEAELNQFMGKDNVPFHTVVFPAMLFAMKDKIPVVRKLSATEYLLFEGAKFSKSRRHGIFGSDIINGTMGIPCVWRYYLLKIRPETKDANFTFSDFNLSVTADLVNNLGNFVQRVLKYIKSKCSSEVALLELDDADEKMVSEINRLYKKYQSGMNDLQLRDSLFSVMEMSRVGNEYVHRGVCGNKERRDHAFSLSVSVVGFIGNLLYPFMPSTSDKILRMCNIKSTCFPSSIGIIDKHTIGNDVYPLFRAFTREEMEEMKRCYKVGEI